MRLEIWHGKATPLTAQGKNQVHLLMFLERFPGWHTVGADKATSRAVEGLLRRGSIAFNQSTNQACIVYAQGSAA